MLAIRGIARRMRWVFVVGWVSRGILGFWFRGEGLEFCRRNRGTDNVLVIALGVFVPQFGD